MATRDPKTDGLSPLAKGSRTTARFSVVIACSVCYIGWVRRQPRLIWSGENEGCPLGATTAAAPAGAPRGQGREETRAGRADQSAEDREAMQGHRLDAVTATKKAAPGTRPSGWESSLLRYGDFEAVRSPRSPTFTRTAQAGGKALRRIGHSVTASLMYIGHSGDRFAHRPFNLHPSGSRLTALSTTPGRALYGALSA